MASCGAVSPPASPLAGSARPRGPAAGGSRLDSRRVALRRWLAELRLAQRHLDDCLGARAGAWFARAVGFGFALAIVFAARPVPGALEALLRVALVLLSWCAGLAALSAAGPQPLQTLQAGRGLWRARGIPLERLRREQWLALAVWIFRHVGSVGLLLVGVCLAVTADAWRAGYWLRWGAGALVYFCALGLGLGLLAQLSRALGGSRGRTLLAALVLVPELVSPAWPELHTVPSGYARLLDLCSSLGAGA